MPPDKKNKPGYNADCKICNHPMRIKIDQDILSKVKVETINQRYAGTFTKDNLKNHKKNHMQPMIRKSIRKLYNKEAIETKNVQVESNELLEKTDGAIAMVIENLDPKDVKMVNALRQLINSKSSQLRQYAKLTGADTKGSQMSLTQFARLLKEERKKIDDQTIVIEKTKKG